MTAASPDTMTTLDEIVDNFSLLEEWDDRYRYVIELGRALDPLSERDRTEANKVQGCASQVWLATTEHADGQGGPVLTFSGDSDAHIVRGLIAILFAMFSGKQAREILIRMIGEFRDWTDLDSFLIRYLANGEERSTAIASSFAATLELVREGHLEIRQHEAFAPLYMRDRRQAPKAIKVNHE